jgi:hypothetical protein
VGIPLSQLIDRQFGDRQDTFRDRVMDSKLTVQSFAIPAKLDMRDLDQYGEADRREVDPPIAVESAT